MFLRVRNQNNIVVNLPSPVARDAELTLNIGYAGPVQPQPIEQESVDRAGRRPSGTAASDDLPFIPPEQNWLFSNRSHWYPQNQVSDYATSTIRFNVPAEYKVVASGCGVGRLAVTTVAGPAGHSTFVVDATCSKASRQPVALLSAVVSRFARVERDGRSPWTYRQ